MMTNEFHSTYEIAEGHWDGSTEPGDVETAMTATDSPDDTSKIEFFIQMRAYTQRDMKELVIEAAARQVVGRFNDSKLSKAIEQRALELIQQKADVKLDEISAEIIDQPMVPSFGKEPVTMREMLGLTGREYLSQKVDSNGKVCSGRFGSHSIPRLERIVMNLIERRFEEELKKSTRVAITEAKLLVDQHHKSVLEEHKALLAKALDELAK